MNKVFSIIDGFLTPIGLNKTTVIGFVMIFAGVRMQMPLLAFGGGLAITFRHTLEKVIERFTGGGDVG